MIILKGRVIDGNGNPPLENGAVVIENNKIKMVCSQYDLPEFENATVLTAENGSILPGLIDAHTHIGMGAASGLGWISATPELNVARGLRDMAQLREQGFTAFRDMGGNVCKLKPAVEEGLLDIPRICGAGRMISQIGGHGDAYQKLTLEASKKVHGPAFICTGVDEVREACRINARNGADFIKIMTTGGVFSEGDKDGPHSHFSEDEIRAAVEEAENMNSYVATHAQPNRGIRKALKNGVKCIEHGYYLDEECVEYMVKHDCYFVPTVAILNVSKQKFDRGDYDPRLEYLKRKCMASYEAHYRALELARKAGVKIGFGSDFLGDEAFGIPYSKANLEFERMKFAGFTALETVKMATKINSELILMKDKVGTLEEGKLADVILVSGNVAEDIEVLCDANNVKVVIQDGRIVKQIA